MSVFHEKGFEVKKTLVEIIISIISTTLVLLTLFEMQAARNASYRPDVSLSLTSIFTSWDANVNNSGACINDPSNLSDVSLINVYNIGVGTAKDITIKWNHQDNFDRFSAAFEQFDDIHIRYIDDTLYIDSNNNTTAYGVEVSTHFDFLLNSSDEYRNMPYPIYYFRLYKELLTRSAFNDEFPELSLVISYTDVQGKTYSKNLIAYVKPVLYEVDISGSGSCSYLLEFVEEDASMLAFGTIFIDGDILNAITAICAVLVSVVSIAFTVYYSKKQNEHNRNSVRPISAIKIRDYENLISISIDNVGTGPMLITRFQVKKGEIEQESLISLMPAIDQNWSTFSSSIDGQTIPVGGKITLLELQPVSESVKDMVRRELSDCIMYLDYADIYATTFHDEKALAFFGRHFT